jgi:Ca-activated chloride channel homolog
VPFHEVREIVYLLTASSGLAGLPADLREALDSVRFTQPDALWLLLLLPVLFVATRWSARQRRAAMGRIGRQATVSGQLTGSASRGRWLVLPYALGWVMLVVGLAGPRWGKSDESGVAVGRDLVVVIDLSRSMWADDMADPVARTRWQAARAGTLDLLDGVARRGGHRVAVVVFAARTTVLCPLTTDYDHVRAVVAEIDGEFPPPEIRPGPVDVISGTRIGAALKVAVETHDSRFPGYQDIVLISDADDPGDDREWARGADEARKVNIPVHTVGVGNPDTPTVLLLGEELVSTQLQEQLLQQIAVETRGQYIAAQRNLPQLGDFFRSHLEPLPGREVSDESIPLPRERYAWFLVPALGLLLLVWLRGS